MRQSILIVANPNTDLEAMLSSQDIFISLQKEWDKASW